MVFRWSHKYKALAIVVGVNILLAIILLYCTNLSSFTSLQWADRIRLTQRAERPQFANYLKMDTRTEPPEWRLRQLIRKELPSLPLETLLENANKGYAKNKSCAAYPTIYDIKFHNDFWQEAHFDDNKIAYIFGAYYDKRLSVPDSPIIRLLTMINEVKDKYPPMYCQLWFDDRREPLIVPVTEHRVIWYAAWGNTPHHIYPTLLACKMPEGADRYKVPQTASLVAHECDMATNNLRVHYEQPAVNEPAADHHHQQQQATNRKRQENANRDENNDLDEMVDAPPPKRLRFAVCVKALNFPYVDMSARIVEWLEMMRILGAEKVTIYEAQLHPNTTRMLRHYERTTGFVDFRSYSMARGEPHSTHHFNHLAMKMDRLNRILNEVIPYNDCFYRNLYNYDVIAVCDIDEVIMPLGNLTNWQQLVDSAHLIPDKNPNCKSWASYCFRNVYYPRYPEKPPHFPDFPVYFYMLQHVERVAKHLDPRLATKCLHTTQYAVTLHNHFPLSWTESCGPKSVPAEMGQMQHYREPDIKETLNDPVIDDNIWRFKATLVNRSMAMFREMGFVPEE